MWEFFLSLSVLRKCNAVLSWFVHCKWRVRLRERLDVSQGVILAFIMKWWCQTCFTCHRGSTSHTESLCFSPFLLLAVLFSFCSVQFSSLGTTVTKTQRQPKTNLLFFPFGCRCRCKRHYASQEVRWIVRHFFYFCVFVCVSACFCVSAFFWLFAKKCFVAIYVSLVIFIHKKRKTVGLCAENELIYFFNLIYKW